MVVVLDLVALQLHRDAKTSPRQYVGNCPHHRDLNRSFHRPYKGEAGMRYRNYTSLSAYVLHLFLFVTDSLRRGVEIDHRLNG